LRKEFHTDLIFLVGPEKKEIKAHKLILSSASPVFETMFYGKLKEESETIKIPDVDFNAFKIMLYVCNSNVSSFLD